MTPVILLAACGQPADPGNASVDLNAAASRAQADVNSYAETTAPPRPVAGDPPVPSAEPDRTVVSEAPFAPDSAHAAATVVQSYYALIGEKNYAAARALWADGGKASGKSPSAFAADFARYRAYRATVGAPGDLDAGAGQRYVTVPVQVDARRGDGSAASWRGDVVLHSTADIDGATAEQKSWRIQSIDLKPAPGNAAVAATPRPPVLSARYRCMDGSKIAVRFDHAAGTAAVTRGGHPLARLDDRRAASGLWYAKAGYELRGQGNAVSLTRPGQPPIPCALIR